jgi:hypothetical protein
MDPTIIVMITTLTLPNGDSGVHLKPFETVAACVEAAHIEESDPFVANVECSELNEGVLTLQFKRQGSKPPASGAAEKAAS